MLRAQVENVIVETYYISDANDATDSTLGRQIEEGSKTYRIYVDLMPGSKIKKIYGDTNHALKISSTANFYNNIDRPSAWFGYLINKGWFRSNPTLALDSWLTIGLAEKINSGILKTDDIDSSFIGGMNNTGGTAGIAGGLLVNDDPLVGIPLTTADGMTPYDSVIGQWLDQGFRNATGEDTSVFGSVVTGSGFISYDAFLQQNSGVGGANSDTNRVLVGQLTTKGELSFELNLEVIEPDLVGTKIVKYVASADTLLDDEQVSPYLKYPPVCGCKNPDYIEYSEIFACDNPESCLTPIVLGCTDSLACNYDPAANYPVSSLCCYVGYCNDRDISEVCPVAGIRGFGKFDMELFPNPVQSELTLLLPSAYREAVIEIFDDLGRRMLRQNIGTFSNHVAERINVSQWKNGLYSVRVFVGDSAELRKFIKN